MPHDESAYRTRLEGRAELLEATLLRYRALANALGALRWKQAVRRNAALVREAAADQGQVDEALEAVERRARAEAWSPRADVVRCAAAVRALREKLEASSLRRLGKDAPGDLGARLAALEQAVVQAPRVVLPGERMATAVDLLPASLPELRQAADFTATWAAVFKRPEGESHLLPYQVGELDALEAALGRAAPALARAWERVARVDAAGTLTRHLRKLARRMPTRPAKNGAEALLAAEFWKAVGLERLERQVAARTSPVELRAGELFEVARWLWAVERDPAARLPAALPLSESRAGLFELAQALFAVTQARSADARVFDRLEERAERAEAALGEGDADAARLRDNLRLFLRVVQREKPSARPGDDSQSLRELVGALRRLAVR